MNIPQFLPDKDLISFCVLFIPKTLLDCFSRISSGTWELWNLVKRIRKIWGKCHLAAAQFKTWQITTCV